MWHCHCCYGRQYNHTYKSTVTQCHIASGVTFANTITLTREPWHSVTFPPLFRSPIQLHFHVYRDAVWDCHSCYGNQDIYTLTCNVTYFNIATFVTVANKITFTREPWHSVTLPLLLRSPIKLHLHLYRGTVWHCHRCYGRQYNHTYICTLTQCHIASVVTVVDTITLTPEPWHSVTFPPLLRSPKLLLLDVYRDTV